jgi:hypothetical protein
MAVVQEDTLIGLRTAAEPGHHNGPSALPMRDAVRPIIFCERLATCWLPEVKGEAGSPALELEKGGSVKRLTSQAAIKRFVILMTLHVADCRAARSPV